MFFDEKHTYMRVYKPEYEGFEGDKCIIVDLETGKIMKVPMYTLVTPLPKAYITVER